MGVQEGSVKMIKIGGEQVPFIVADGGVTVAKNNKLKMNLLQKGEAQYQSHASLGSNISLENEDLTYD